MGTEAPNIFYVHVLSVASCNPTCILGLERQDSQALVELFWVYEVNRCLEHFILLFNSGLLSPESSDDIDGLPISVFGKVKGMARNVALTIGLS